MLILDENDANGHRHQFEVTSKVWFIVYILMCIMLCLPVLYKMCRKLHAECRYDLKDIFKISQLTCFVLYLITRNGFLFILIIDSIGIFYIPAISFWCFFFHYYELINNLWWVCFIIHIHACKPHLMGNEIKEKTRFKQKCCWHWSQFSW